MKEGKVFDNIDPCLTRRRFLDVTIDVAAAIILFTSFPGATEVLHSEVVEYPSKRIARLSELKINEPDMIHFPDAGLNSLGFVTKLSMPVARGVGPDSDVVAYNILSTHLKGDLRRRRGTSTEDRKFLSQVLLEVRGDNVYATGVMRMIFRKRDSLGESTC